MVLLFQSGIFKEMEWMVDQRRSFIYRIRKHEVTWVCATHHLDKRDMGWLGFQFNIALFWPIQTAWPFDQFIIVWYVILCVLIYENVIYGKDTFWPNWPDSKSWNFFSFEFFQKISCNNFSNNLLQIFTQISKKLFFSFDT